MSNVEHHVGPASSWLLMRLRSAPQSQLVCEASRPFESGAFVATSRLRGARCLPRKLNTSPAPHRGVEQEEGHGRVASEPRVRDRAACQSQSVVGASRRSAAPGGQYWGAARGSAGLAHLFRPELRSTMLSRSSRLATSVALEGRDAQLIHREDVPRQAGSRLSCLR